MVLLISDPEDRKQEDDDLPNVTIPTAATAGTRLLDLI
jgi:hypothetical protein